MTLITFISVTKNENVIIDFGKGPTISLHLQILVNTVNHISVGPTNFVRIVSLNLGKCGSIYCKIFEFVTNLSTHVVDISSRVPCNDPKPQTITQSFLNKPISVHSWSILAGRKNLIRNACLDHLLPWSCCGCTAHLLHKFFFFFKAQDVG